MGHPSYSKFPPTSSTLASLAYIDEAEELQSQRGFEESSEYSETKSITSTSQLSESKSQTSSSASMALLVVSSVFLAAVNQLSYKVTLNSFSSKSTNYGFFVNQAGVLLYLIPTAILSLVILLKNPNSLKKLLKSSWEIFLWMGLLDASSSTLGSIAGAYTPGQLQTILNQSIIPITMLLCYLFLGYFFKYAQISGASCILFGAIFASSSFFFSPSTELAISSTRYGAIIVYFISIVFSSLSNVYKDHKMKQDDLDEVHTSTIVSLWQLIFGFLFLPLLNLPALGGLTVEEMSHQLQDGYLCLRGHNPTKDDDCSYAFNSFVFYTIVNFFYNILLLVITKRGNAVLLVISQALSLPITNLCFAIPAIMGNENVEPLSIHNVIGLVFVMLGFLIYSGFGLAENFLVLQGPSGQMTYAHVDQPVNGQILLNRQLLLHEEDELATLLIHEMKREIYREDLLRKKSLCHKESDGEDSEAGFEVSSMRTSLQSNLSDSIKTHDLASHELLAQVRVLGLVRRLTSNIQLRIQEKTGQKMSISNSPEEDSFQHEQQQPDEVSSSEMIYELMESTSSWITSTPTRKTHRPKIHQYGSLDATL